MAARALRSSARFAYDVRPAPGRNAFFAWCHCLPAEGVSHRRQVLRGGQKPTVLAQASDGRLGVAGGSGQRRGCGGVGVGGHGRGLEGGGVRERSGCAVFAKKNVGRPPLDLIKLMALDNSKRALAANWAVSRLGRPARRALGGQDGARQDRRASKIFSPALSRPRFLRLCCPPRPQPSAPMRCSWFFP